MAPGTWNARRENGTVASASEAAYCSQPHSTRTRSKRSKARDLPECGREAAG
jgi:hypothetical protein